MDGISKFFLLIKTSFIAITNSSNVRDPSWSVSESFLIQGKMREEEWERKREGREGDEVERVDGED